MYAKFLDYGIDREPSTSSRRVFRARLPSPSNRHRRRHALRLSRPEATRAVQHTDAHQHLELRAVGGETMTTIPPPRTSRPNSSSCHPTEAVATRRSQVATDATAGSGSSTAPSGLTTMRRSSFSMLSASSPDPERVRSDTRDPVPFRPVKRFDRDRKPHFNKVTGEYVPTPHMHDPTTAGGVRPPRPDEIPR
jgi:hypothetical protein